MAKCDFVVKSHIYSSFVSDLKDTFLCGWNWECSQFSGPHRWPVAVALVIATCLPFSGRDSHASRKHLGHNTGARDPTLEEMKTMFQVHVKLNMVSKSIKLVWFPSTSVCHRQRISTRRPSRLPIRNLRPNRPLQTATGCWRGPSEPWRRQWWARWTATRFQNFGLAALD